MSTIIERKISVKSRNYEVKVEFYNSAAEVYEDCKRRKITDRSFKDMEKEHMGSFEGVKNYDEALGYLRGGYQPTVERLREKLNIKDPGQKRISFTNNVVGAAPVVPLALKGVPNCMIDTKMKRIKCKVIDVYYDMTCSCGTDSEDIIKNGQKLLGAILDLEHQGYRFNIYAMQTYSDNKGVDMLAVKIKSSNQPLDLKRMSFPLTHTAFFRVIGFDWYSKFPKGKYRCGYGHALGYEFNKKECDSLVHEVFGNNAILVIGKDILHEGEAHIREVLEDAGKKIASK